MSQWCRSALCGHPLPTLIDNWTHGAASRHTIAPISHTRPLPCSRSYHVCLTRTNPAHTLGRQARSFVWGSRSTRKKWIHSQLVHRQANGEQCNSQVSHHRPCCGREPCHRLGQGKWSTERHRWIKEALWIRKTPMCMNRDAGSYQLSHTWDHSRSHAPSSCKQSRCYQLRCPTDIETLLLGDVLQLCRVRSYQIILFSTVDNTGVVTTVAICLLQP